MSRTLCPRDPKYKTGAYSKMFEIDAHGSNKNFVSNMYRPGSCQCNDMVCFSLTHGALPCKPDQTRMLVFNAEGDLVSVPVKHTGPVSSKNIKHP